MTCLAQRSGQLLFFVIYSLVERLDTIHSLRFREVSTEQQQDRTVLAGTQWRNRKRATVRRGATRADRQGGRYLYDVCWFHTYHCVAGVSCIKSKGGTEAVRHTLIIRR